MKEKSERYINSQKRKFSKTIDKNNDYMGAFYKACKKGTLGIYFDYLLENGKTVEFQGEAWAKLSNRNEYKDQLMAFASVLEIENLRRNSCEELAYKAQSLYAEGKLKYFDLFQLSITNIKKEQQEEIGKLLDVCTDESMDVGIHRTGGNVSGETLCNEGIELTGHLSSGVNSRSYSREDLNTNISFYNEPGLTIRSIYTGGNYKNYRGARETDIAVVCIPKGIMENTQNDVIINGGEVNVLNPKYIYGYATVDAMESTLVDCKVNEKCYLNNRQKAGLSFPDTLSQYVQPINEQAAYQNNFVNTPRSRNDAEFQK